jgi:hypothetical protein
MKYRNSVVSLVLISALGAVTQVQAKSIFPNTITCSAGTIVQTAFLKQGANITIGFLGGSRASFPTNTNVGFWHTVITDLNATTGKTTVLGELDEATFGLPPAPAPNFTVAPTLSKGSHVITTKATNTTGPILAPDGTAETCTLITGVKV